MKRKIIAQVILAMAIIAGAMLPQKTEAVPANRKPLQITQPDGSVITVRLHGDEWFHWVTDLNGDVLVQNANGFYLKANAEQLEAFRQEQTAGEQRRNTANNQRIAQLRARHQTQRMGVDNDLDTDSLPSHLGFNAHGARQGLLVLVEYQDVRFSIENPLEQYTNMMNQEGYHYTIKDTISHYGSVHDYFYQNSMGDFDLHFDVYGPIRLQHERNYYGSSNDRRAPEMIIEACQYLDSIGVDLSRFDNDNDSIIDFVCAIYAGAGQNSTGTGEQVWPHTWNLTSAGYAPTYFQGLQLMTYSCVNEIYGKYMDGMGTFCHEFGHIMGLPDEYSTSYSTPCSPYEYDIMDLGSYLRRGYYPCGYSSYERYEMGWLKPTLLDTQSTDTLTYLGTSNQAFIVPVSDSTECRDGEYYLFENRQQTAWDKYIPGHGMLVWHIDYSTGKWEDGTVNNWLNHQCIDLIEADGKKYDADGYYTQDDTTPFPGSAGHHAFTDDTDPAFSGWTSPHESSSSLLNRLGKPISNIQEEMVEIDADSATNIITFNFMFPAQGIKIVQKNEVASSAQSRLLMIDNQLFIITPEGQKYNLEGRREE